MEIYTFLRHLADSWVLLLMTLFFFGMCVWAFRPGSRAAHQDIATSIFRNDDHPAADPAPSRKEA